MFVLIWEYFFALIKVTSKRKSNLEISHNHVLRKVWAYLCIFRYQWASSCNSWIIFILGWFAATKPSIPSQEQKTYVNQLWRWIHQRLASESRILSIILFHLWAPLQRSGTRRSARRARIRRGAPFHLQSPISTQKNAACSVDKVLCVLAHRKCANRNHVSPIGTTGSLPTIDSTGQG